VRTTLPPDALLRFLHTVEAQYGRNREVAPAVCQDRTLDLDLLLYDDLTLATERLVIPHPRMARRLFVLAPLTEIAADRIHPGYGKAIGVLLTELQRTSHGQVIERISW